VADEGANDATADQQATLVCHQVNVHVGSREQPHLPFRQQSQVGDINHGKLTAGSQPYLRERFVAGDGTPGRPPTFDDRVTAQQASSLFAGRIAARVCAR